MEIKLNIGSKIPNLLSRKTSTNPFDNVSFTGRPFGANALPFADVFQTIKPIEHRPNKLKMISGAVIGAMNRFRDEFQPPIARFAHEIRQRISNGILAIKSTGNALVQMNRIAFSRFDEMIHPQRFDTFPHVLKPNHISPRASVQDLRATWIAQNAKTNIEEAFNTHKAVI